MFESNVAIVLL